MQLPVQYLSGDPFGQGRKSVIQGRLRRGLHLGCSGPESLPSIGSIPGARQCGANESPWMLSIGGRVGSILPRVRRSGCPLRETARLERAPTTRERVLRVAVRLLAAFEYELECRLERRAVG